MKVLIQSFSFQKTGYPVDRAGHGGGFVFDCRGIDAFDYTDARNLEAPFPYLNFTGLDPEIRDVMDSDRESQDFFRAVWVLVDQDIKKFLRRGFNNMTVNFGCTAGRHRSVYMAERLAKKIKGIFPNTEIELNHLERAHWPRK